MNNNKASISPDTNPVGLPSRTRVRIGIAMTLTGMLILLLGIQPALFGLNRSPVVGLVQIAVSIFGLTILCLGGYIGLTAFWKNGDRTIVADIGTRLVATGYVMVFFVAMADNFGITQTFAKTHFFGPWQAIGMQVGEAVIAIGFLMLIPFRKARPRT